MTKANICDKKLVESMTQNKVLEHVEDSKMKYVRRKACGKHDMNLNLYKTEKIKKVRCQVTENYVNKSKMIVIYLNLLNDNSKKNQIRDIQKVRGVFYFNLLEFFLQVETIFVSDEVVINCSTMQTNLKN